MRQQAIFGVSVLFGFVVWGILGAQYVWPALRRRSRLDALFDSWDWRSSYLVWSRPTCQRRSRVRSHTASSRTGRQDRRDDCRSRCSRCMGSIPGNAGNT
jgi:hypothetical protein